MDDNAEAPATLSTPSAPPTPNENAARFGNTGHIHFHSNVEKPRPRKVADLVSKPVIRQWIAGGKLYREESSREMPRIELFFDLLYVGVIHQLAEVAAESPNGASVLRFVLTLWPAWSIWEEARRYSNVSGSDDLAHRVWVLIGMLCILGYAANASAIELDASEAGVAYPAFVGVGKTASQVAFHGSRFVRALAGVDTTADTTAAFGQDTAVHAAAAFFLLIKLTRVLVLWIYALALPDFRMSQILGGCAVLIPMFVYLPLLFVTSRRAQICIAIAGMVVDLIRFDVLMYYLGSRYLHWKKRRAGGESSHSVFRIADLPAWVKLPAVNIEHSIERSGAFVVIVLGEMIANLCYTASGPPSSPVNNYGAGPMYGKAALGLMVAWALNYLYTIPSDSNVVRYEHALRHSWLTGVAFNFLHFLLCGALVLASAASGILLRNEEVDSGVKWFWGAGLGLALLFTVTLDILHHNLETWRAQTIPRVVRYAVGVTGSLVLILNPLRTQSFNSTQNLATGVVVTWTVLAVYIFGTIATAYAEVEEFHEPGITNTLLRTEPHRSLFSGSRDAESCHSAHSDDLAVL